MIKRHPKDEVSATQEELKNSTTIADIDNEVLVKKDQLDILTDAKFSTQVNKTKNVSSKKSKSLMALFGTIAGISLAAGAAMLTVGIIKANSVPKEETTIPHTISFEAVQEGWELHCSVSQATKGETVKFWTYKQDQSNLEWMKAPTTLMINDYEFALTKLDSYTYGAEIQIPVASNMTCKLKFEDVLAYNIVILDAGEDAYFASTNEQYIIIPVSIGSKLSDCLSYEEPIYKDISKSFSSWYDELNEKPFDMNQPIYTNAYLTPKSQSSFADPLAEYKSAIGIKALSDLTIYLDNKTGETKNVQYSTDGTNWQDIETSSVDPLQVSKGTNLYLKGLNDTFNISHDEAKSVMFKINGYFTLSGSIMGLLDNGKKTKLDIPNDNCFAYLFAGNKGLTAVQEDFLPSSNLSKYCYYRLFDGCSILHTAPKLPAEDLTDCDYCYNYMFQDCIKLQNCPTLISQKLAPHCYDCMFIGCRSIVQMPSLPAQDLQDGCYQYMFSACSNLTKVSSLPAKILTTDCYLGMFRDCSNLPTVPALSATTAAKECCRQMFYGCHNIITIPTDYLSNITTLAPNCFQEMFRDCTSLKNTCLLPVEDLEDWCYGVMFGDCFNIQLCNGFKLPSKTAKERCYANMFTNCRELSSAPVIELTEVAEHCCIEMFEGCSKLKVNNTGASGTKFFVCPDLTTYFNACKDMFKNTAGPFIEDPVADDSYYFE